MSRSTISTFQLFATFPDEESARKYLEGRLWADGVKCPECKGSRVGTRPGGFYRCPPCGIDFTVRTGTILERSHVPLHKWAVAFMLVGQSPDISSEVLAREIKVTQKTAWLMLCRIHEGGSEYLKLHLDLENPQFRSIGDAYRVGADGSVWSRRRMGASGRLGFTWHEMKPTVDKKGYRNIRLQRGGSKWMQRRVCRLICEAFHGPCPQGQECRHLNGNAEDDAASNLAWGTHIENSADMVRHGRSTRGEKHPMVKLTNAQVAEIRAVRGTSQRKLAKQFGISQSYLSRVLSGQYRTYQEVIA